MDTFASIGTNETGTHKTYLYKRFPIKPKVLGIPEDLLYAKLVSRLGL